MYQIGKMKMVIAYAVLFLLMIKLGCCQFPFKPIHDAEAKKAVCIDGTPGGYFHAPGSGDGANNWLLFLRGGGWCWPDFSCAERATTEYGSSINATIYFPTGLLSGNRTVNPDFYSWNRVFIYYCDGGSFLGDTEAIDNGTLVQLRGSRIYNAVMEELLEIGMKYANNAILSGASAGGLATILHCDDFRALLPNANRVKCLSDAGFFLRGKYLPFAWRRERMYSGIEKLHNLTSYLPSYCTSKRDAGLCLFAEYLVGHVKTPLFVLNSAFDQYQLHNNLNLFPTPPDWEKCMSNIISGCTPLQAEVIKDFGSTFLSTLESLDDDRSRGYLITSCYIHGTMISDGLWSNPAYGLLNTSIRQIFADWYFNETYVKLITGDTFPTICV